jgi:hypothetical protein
MEIGSLKVKAAIVQDREMREEKEGKRRERYTESPSHLLSLLSLLSLSHTTLSLSLSLIQTLSRSPARFPPTAHTVPHPPHTL